MTDRVLVVGAAGRFGRAAAEAFATSGWEVHALTRDGSRVPEGCAAHAGDAGDPARLSALAAGCGVIVHAANAPYPDWPQAVPAFTRATLAAARASGATVLIPGNVYVFGRRMPEVLGPDTPHRADTRKGRLRAEMEAEFRAAAPEVRSIVLRCGDFLDPGRTGNWWDLVLAEKLAGGRFVYPGRRDAAHAWAWLEDAARAAVALAERRDTLPAFADIPFPGIAPTGDEMVAGLKTALGRSFRVARFPWPLIRLGAPFNPMFREIAEMRYLWDVPHRLDAGPLTAVLPGFEGLSEGEIYARLAEAI